ncbi:MAG: HNH endonuclease [Candidatus Marinimicrobia bacterium]|nr:HNH endonuclease [Candidatus Neomarinimicrobiota bacterium]
MSFSEEIKLKIKKKSNFTCCWCQDIRNKVEIHHIIPESKNGPDDEDNAAPLCSNCHTLYGSNTDLVKEIKQRRNYWYDICKSKYYKYLNEAGKDDVKNEIPVIFSILFNSKIFRISTTLHPTWAWELVCKILVTAFKNNPAENEKIFLPEDFNEYHPIDLISESWISYPKTANDIKTERIALIHKNELVKFKELNHPLKAKAFSKVIKFMEAKR